MVGFFKKVLHKVSRGELNCIRDRKALKMSGEAKMVANIGIMNQLESFDVVIICCSKDKQASYWQKRLNDGKGSIVSNNCTIIAVDEDWPGGAGNGM